MTHGCLIVQRENEERFIALHTYHTGMDIPRAVRRSLTRWALHYTYMFDWWVEARNRAELERDFLGTINFADGYDWPPTVAGWIISTQPGFLAPMPPAYWDSLPPWSGTAHPYRLWVSEEWWRLFDPDEQLLFELEPYPTLVGEVWTALAPVRRKGLPR